MVDRAMPAASTGTTVPSRLLHSNGVMKMAPSVVAVVINTDKATLPLAMYVHKLLACPPLTHPTNTMPAMSGPLKPNALPNINASAGIMA